MEYHGLVPQYLSRGTAIEGDASSTLQSLLEAVRAGHVPPTFPLTFLRTSLAERRLQCSVYKLVRCYADCWKSLPESAKSGQDDQYNALIETTSSLVKSSYSSILDLIPKRNGVPAIIDGTSGKSITQKTLFNFIQNFRLPLAGSDHGGRTVAVVLPNGPLLGIVSMAVATYYTLAPINATSGVDQLRSDILGTGAKAVLVLREHIEQFGFDRDWVAQHGIQIFIVSPSEDMTCTILPLKSHVAAISASPTPNGPDDTSIILFTSGTTGTKKIVPITLHSIISAVSFISQSWGLTDQDICINMMPLNHIGGLLRSLYSPILLGGSTICCSAFDPNLFWDLVLDRKATWYYASPSMHSAILDEAPGSETILRNSCIRMVCNAAGGLLPSLSVQLRSTFRCTVLPSYGMTECMPISTPPLSYELERPGTSGISVGPELAILNDAGRRQSAGRLGRICVRGNPLFPGYMIDGKLDKSVFNSEGWFDTGDLGYMDSDGYLYITGRSKEVINRGGEIISPFEVEEAIIAAANDQESLLHGRIAETLAFSVPHQALQEAVGVVIVTPAGKPRIDLRQLQESVKQSLHSSKVPIVLVYMDSVPKRNGKLLRTQLGERLGFEPICDDAKMMDRHFEARCPPADTPLSIKMQKNRCKIEERLMVEAVTSYYGNQVDVFARPNIISGLLDVVLAPKSRQFTSYKLDTSQLKSELQNILPGYCVPGKCIVLDDPFPRDIFGIIDPSTLEKLLTSRINGAESASVFESKIREIFSNLLSVPTEDVLSNSDFFELGGDSLRAGRLLSTLRKEFGIRIPIDQLFSASRVQDLTQIIEQQRPTDKARRPDKCIPVPTPSRTYSSTSIFTLLLQLLPLTVVSPFKKALHLTIFLKAWGIALRYMHGGVKGINLIFLLLSMLAARAVLAILMPILSIAAKWAIIGRYKEGLYPMWSTYHNRWWIVSKIMHVCGMGMFKHFNWSRILFYRLLGAKIGKGVRIQPNTVLGEYDLLDIGDNVELDRCVCRGFAVEHNTTMYLGKIRMGKNSAAGLKTIIAPGTDVPEDTCLGMNSSSWESDTADGSNYNLLASRIPQPHWLMFILFSIPILFMVKTLSLVPWVVGLSGLVVSDPPEGGDLVLFVFNWFSSPARVGFHFLARIMHVVLSPMVFLALVVALKRLTDLLFGKMKPSLAARRSHLDRLRMALMSEFIPNGNISEVAGFFGTHYEITSIIVRALGGKVGKRVYWPGNGPSIQNFDMVDIGDDVVFGSWAHLISSDGTGCDVTRIDNGAMVADRVVVLPGCRVGKQAVLGSGTLTQRNVHYAPSTTWIGSKADGPICLSIPNSSASSTQYQAKAIPSLIQDVAETLEEKYIAYESVTERSSSSDSSRGSDDLSLLLPDSSSGAYQQSTTPFGRAFYQKQAPYRVWSLSAVTAYCFLANILISIYWNVPTILCLQLLNKVANKSYLSSYFAASSYRSFLVLSLLFISLSILQLIFSGLALAICIAAKWILIGQREPGDYDWDQSSYCQRWKLLLAIERIRRKHLSGEDIIGLLTGTYYCAQYFRLLGADIGKDCALYAGGEMSFPLTEPDLVTIGDRVAMDDASLVAHINSRGNFKLNQLVVGDRCVLRAGSRLLSGGTMTTDSCLLEHTLILGGDETDAGATYQGWPANDFTGERVILEETKTALSEKNWNEKAKQMNGAPSTDQKIWSRFGVVRRIWSYGSMRNYERLDYTSDIIEL